MRHPLRTGIMAMCNLRVAQPRARSRGSRRSFLPFAPLGAPPSRPRRPGAGALLLGLVLALAAGARAQEAPAGGGELLLGHLEKAFEGAADRVAPAVAALEVDRAPEPEPSPGEEVPPYARRPAGLVSGVWIAPDRVLTSAYNLDGAKRVAVLGPRKERLAAKVLGRDDAADLALVELEQPSPGGSTAAIEARPAPKVGSFVVVVGRGPSGEPGVNAGIVSALSRQRGDAIQTDAPLNFGNYGGAAVDLDGRLVGIAVRPSLTSRAGVNSGVGFLVPCAKIRELLPLLERGQSRRSGPRAFLGIRFGRELSDPPGVEITEVTKGSGAAECGLEKGDILRRVADAEAIDALTISEAIQARQPGDQIRIIAERGGRLIGFEARLGERPTEER
jgi:putative serine protease PepD